MAFDLLYQEGCGKGFFFSSLNFFLLTDIKINKITLNYEMKCEEKGEIRKPKKKG